MNIVVINLLRAEKRKDSIISQLDSQKLQYVVYTGFDGANITNLSFSPQITIGWGKGRILKNGEIGCTLSHIGVISMAKVLGWEYVVVLEDDIVICKDFKSRLDKVFKMVPKDWEHIFLGGFTYNYTPLVQPCLVQSPKTSGTYSYIIHNRVYDKVLKGLSSLQTTTDDLYGLMELKSYIFFPFFSYPLLGYSYVNEESGNATEHPSKKLFKEYL